jgi:hypothetical protein
MIHGLANREAIGTVLKAAQAARQQCANAGFRILYEEMHNICTRLAGPVSLVSRSAPIWHR